MLGRLLRRLGTQRPLELGHALVPPPGWRTGRRRRGQAHDGGVLFAAGRWDEAEAELERALRTATANEPAQRVRAHAALAELRLAQGRVEEAARLLDGQADRPEAARALGAVRLATGEPAAAAAVLGRRLRDGAEFDVASAPLHELLAAADLAQGDVAAARQRARRVAETGAERGSDVIAAPGERALGRVLAATGEHDAAVDRLERALAAYVRLELPYEAARTRLALAEALGPVRAEAAIAEAREALAALEALGAGGDADAAAALLRSLGVKAARSGPKGLGVLTKREREVLALLGEGLTNRQIAERLVVAPKTAENHVSSVLFKLELTGRAQAAAYAVRHTTPPPGREIGILPHARRGRSWDRPPVTKRMTDTHPAIVVGAGPAGLAAAAELGRRRIPAVVVERGDAVGASWHGRYDRLRLNSSRWFSQLPGARFGRAAVVFPGRDDVIRYLDGYAERHELDVRLRTAVERIDRDGDGYVVRTSAGDIRPRMCHGDRPSA